MHADAASCTLGIVSPDGEAGYPGTLHVTCRYTLTEANALRVELAAFTDKPTIVNLCHHSYFNLDGGADILDHSLAVRANVMTPVDGDLIPDGSLAPVSGTPFDFRKPPAHPASRGRMERASGTTTISCFGASGAKRMPRPRNRACRDAREREIRAFHGGLDLGALPADL